MGVELLTDRYANQIAGTLCCYDRIIIQGTLPKWCYASGMTEYFYAHNIRIFDYSQWAQPLREAIRENAERMAAENGIEIEFIRSKKKFRQQDRVKEVLNKRGAHPGLVCILSAMEPCGTYKPWHDKKTHKTYLKPDDGKCLHYYFYFIDEELGLCSARLPTWCPFRLQFYCNGHSYLARQMDKRRIEYRALDNAFGWIADSAKAQKLADGFGVEMVHRKLDEFAASYCPVLKQFELSYHWSLDQVEFATDIVFRQQGDLQAIYERLTRAAIHTVKPDNIATFLGRKLNGNYQDEMGNRFNTRIEGTRIKHTMGPVSIKMYDKFRLILRIETTVVNVSFFKHYREVEHKDGTRSMAWAEMKKTIYSLAPLRELLLAANRRYLEFISAIADDKAGTDKLNKISQPVEEHDRAYRGFNFFDPDDEELFRSLGSGEFNISGFQNKDLRRRLQNRNSGQISRTMKRLRLHGLIKKVGRTYKYYVTAFGKQVIALGLKLKELYIIPALSAEPVR
ncbi:MAG TPA: MarR family transcriptional regulator [Terriglobia bacterium]|nr:MarR family transcriptional regulator [Terriglobia bacterium]